MKFKVNGNFLSTEVLKSRKSGEDYRVVKVLVGDDNFTCFTNIDLDVNNFNRLDEVIIYFDLTSYNSNFNLTILGIEKMK